MCGIACLFGPAVSGDRLHAMLGVAARRGPQGTSFTALPGGLVGHSALHFVDVGHNAQPLTLADGSCLVWNGEIYNWPALRHSHGLAARNDTQALLLGLREHGIPFLRELDGQFALVAYLASGEHAGQTWLARDKWGICPISYGYTEDGWLAVGSTHEVVARAGVREPKSVPAGTCGRIQHTSVQLSVWYRLPVARPAQGVEIEQVRGFAQQRVRSRIPERPEELYTTLGGIDSQFVTATVARAVEGRFGGAVTVVPDAAGGAAREAGSDLPYARATLEMLASEGVQVAHHVAVLSPDFVEQNLDRLVRLLGPDLFHILCGLAEDLIAATVARLGGRVIMTAGGPDEAGRSYDRWTLLHRGLDEELAWRRLAEQFGSSEGVRAGLIFGERGLENRVPLADLIELACAIPASQKQRVLDEGDGHTLSSFRMEGKLFWKQALRGVLPEICLRAPKQPIHGTTGALQAVFSVARGDRAFNSARQTFALHAYELGWNGIVFGNLCQLDSNNALTECQLYALYRFSLLQPELFSLGGQYRYGRYVGYLPRFDDDPVERRHKPLCYDWLLGVDVPLRFIR